MAAIELLTGSATAPSTTLTALTMYSGNSLTVRSFDESKGQQAHLVAIWGKVQGTVGAIQIFSPRMHDQVQGIRTPIIAAFPLPVFPFGLGVDQPLKSQDTLTAKISGSAVGGQIEIMSALLYYEELAGAKASLIDCQALRLRSKNVKTVLVQCNPGTGGGYDGQKAINSFEDTLKANVDYALLGFVTDTLCGSIRLQGVDTGNLGVGCPGLPSRPDLTSMWFPLMSKRMGVPMIPVLNAANKGGILIDVAQDQAGVDPNIGVVLAELSPVR